MFSIRHSIRWPSRAERQYFLNLLYPYICTVILFYVGSIPDVIRAIGRQYVGPSGLGAFPLVLLGLLLLLFWALTREDVRHEPNFPTVSMTQYFLGALALVLCTVLSLVITHPSPLLSGRMFGIMEAYPEIGGPFMGAVVYLIMVLPLVPALACFIPPIVLRPRLGLLGFGAALFMAFLFSEVVNAYYYYLTGPFIVSSVKAVLSLISHAPDAPVGRWGISFGDFRVMLGYSCTELSSFLLFFGLVGFSWWRYRPQGFLRNAGLFVLVVMGLVFLWFLNIARIVAVMMVGSLNPELAIGIFHSAAGPILFFGFFLVYIRFVLRLVHAGSAVRKKATA